LKESTKPKYREKEYWEKRYASNPGFYDWYLGKR
jgi:hypothetical protein